MASTASTILRLELMANGENDGTWGTKVNTNLGILESALTGTTAISTTGGDTTLTNVDYTNDQAKKLALDVTGALVSNATIVIPNAAKSYKVFNRTSGSYTLTIKTPSGSGILITQSTGCEVYCDGANVVRYITPLTDFTTGAPATSSGAAASAVSVVATGNLSSTNAQAALVELQTDINTINSTLTSSYQPLDADLTAIGALAKTDGNFIVGNGSTWVAESGATARTSVGLGTGDSPQFTAIELGHASDTTLSRVSAGRMAVEGVNVVTVSSTDTMTNKTMTSPTLNSPTLTTPVLGTPSSGTLSSCTGLPIVAGTTGTLSVARGGTGVTASTGSGNVVLSTSPTLTTPDLGTPSSGTLTSCTGLPINNGTTGTLPIDRGGTGATVAATAFTNLKQAATTTATGVVELATQAEVVSASDAARVAALDMLKYHPGIAKVYGKVTYSGGTPTLVAGSLNVTSITDSGQGHLTVTIEDNFANANYIIQALCQDVDNALRSPQVVPGSQTVGSFALYFINSSDSPQELDPEAVHFVCFGQLA